MEMSMELSMLTNYKGVNAQPKRLSDLRILRERRLSGHLTVPIRVIFLLAVLSALTIVLAACQDEVANDLRGTAWELTSLSESGLLSDTTITLEFSDDELTGSAGCNRYGATYQISGNSFTVSDLHATEMGCPEPAGILEQEQTYLAALRSADSFQLSDHEFEILDEAGASHLLFATHGGATTTNTAVTSDQPVVIQNVPVPTAMPDPTPAPEVATATPVPLADPPSAYERYEDLAAGVSLFIPDEWIATQVVPGQSAILQSYSETKYIGGGARDPADTKCDLTIRPPEVDLASHLEQVRSDPTITILSETEIVLQSGRPGISFDLESLGRHRSFATEVNASVIVLTCYGELTLFDELARSIQSSAEH